MSRIAIAVAAGILAAVPAVVASLGGDAPASAPRCPRRIVSMSPHATAALLALGAGDSLVGVDAFSGSLPEAAGLPRLGSYVDPDVERIVALGPDLVVTAATDARLPREMARFGVAVAVAPDTRLDDVYRTIETLGRAACREAAAARLAASLRGEIAAVAARRPGGPAPRAVLVVDRTPDDLRQFFVAGSDNFLSDLLAAAGARNAFDGARSAFPQVSLEPILAADPDLLIELAPGASAAEVADRLGTWRRLAPGMRAVRNGSVRVLTDRTLPVPGPGVGATVRALAAVVDAARRGDAEGDAR